MHESLPGCPQSGAYHDQLNTRAQIHLPAVLQALVVFTTQMTLSYNLVAKTYPKQHFS